MNRKKVQVSFLIRPQITVVYLCSYEAPLSLCLVRKQFVLFLTTCPRPGSPSVFNSGKKIGGGSKTYFFLKPMKDGGRGSLSLRGEKNRTATNRFRTICTDEKRETFRSVATARRWRVRTQNSHARRSGGHGWSPETFSGRLTSTTASPDDLRVLRLRLRRAHGKTPPPRRRYRVNTATAVTATGGVMVCLIFFLILDPAVYFWITERY